MSALPLKLGILGIRGRMGQALLQEAERNPAITVVAGKTRTLSPSLSGLYLFQEALPVFKACDVIVDFSHPEVLASHLKDALSTQKPLLIGTTGLSEKDQACLKEASTRIPILHAPNTSLGVAILEQAVSQAARLFDLSYDVEISESHHHHKRDAPSGTALLLGDVVKKAREDRGLSSPSICPSDRKGERLEGAIGYSVVRGGGLKGEHHVHFIGPHERIIFSHEAFGRELFAQGALLAARWLSHQKAGLYRMQEVWKN